MKRIFSLLAVTALMVAMLLASAMPAFAEPKNDTAPNCERGNNQAFDSGQQKEQRQSSLDKNYFGTDSNGNDKNPNAAHCLPPPEA